MAKVSLFVYGTLKSGYINHDRYLQVAVNEEKATLISTGTTEEKFPLVLRPLTRLPATRGPMLLSTHRSSESEWSTIDGEVYEIDESTLEAMDILEGVSSGLYYRTHIPITLHTQPTRQVVSQCYFYTVQEGDSDLVEAYPLLGVYDDEAHDQYTPGPLSQDILTLLTAEAGSK